jgi:hypothetical protein
MPKFLLFFQLKLATYGNSATSGKCRRLKIQVWPQQDTDITAGFGVPEGYPAARTALKYGRRLIYDAKLLEREGGLSKVEAISRALEMHWDSGAL